MDTRRLPDALGRFVRWLRDELRHEAETLADTRPGIAPTGGPDLDAVRQVRRSDATSPAQPPDRR